MSVISTSPNLAEQIYQLILSEICDGVLPPGSHLIQEQLAERFEVSRQPIQQAMALLKADGLVEEKGKRGLYVATLDLALMSHHYDIRAALDGLAASAAANRLQDDANLLKSARLRGRLILDAGTAAIEAGIPHEQIRQDEAFHNLIYELSGNPLLAPSAEFHWRFLRRAMADVLRYAAQPVAIWRQHRKILNLILSGQADKAQLLAIEHVQSASRRLVATLAVPSETAVK